MRVAGAFAALLAAACALPAAADAGRGPCAGTALVLSGGGARGAAHVGVLEVLEAERVPVSCVVGTSMGAVVGSLYAAGYSPAELRRIYDEIDWAEALDDRPSRRAMSFRAKQDDDEALFRLELGLGGGGLVLPSGLVAGQKLAYELRRLTLHVADVDSFDRLPLPFRAIATDLAEGTMVVLDRGDLADAVRASMAVPGAFTPAEIDGRVLVDGGVVNNLPVDVARSLGARRVIAVDVSTLPDREIADRSAIGVASQTLLLLTDENVRRRRASMREGDVLIVPRLASIGPTDFARYDEAIDDGVAAAREVEAALGAFALEPEPFERHLARLRAGRRRAPGVERIDSVELVGLERVDPRYVIGRIRTRPGDGFDLVRLRRDLERIYQSGAFEQVGFDLDREDDAERLVIRAREKSWGPYFLRLGLSLESNFEGQGRFNALGILTRTQLNPLGAEWKTTVAMGEPDLVSSEIWQPLDFGGTWFVSPQVEFRQARRVAVDRGGLPAVSDDEFLVGRLDLGAQLGNWGEIRVGAARGEVDTRFSSPLGDAAETVSIGSWRARLILDRLDNANFPRAGHYGSWTLELSRAALGADLEYDRLRVSLLQAVSAGRDTFVGRFELGSSLGSALPRYDRFSLGGFLNLSGLEAGELRGDVLGLVSLIYYREIMRLPGPLGGGVYVGGSIEAGNVWPDLDAADVGDLRPAGMAFFGADTLLGPVYLGYGRAEGGADSIYLFLGLPF